jgi:hypothetical protein
LPPQGKREHSKQIASRNYLADGCGVISLEIYSRRETVNAILERFHGGYSTGNADPGTAARRKILRKCFEGPVPNVHGPDYMQEWGRNKTLQRLSKMAWSIATFASNQINKNGGHVDEASRLWKEDLQWLRKEFYEGHFGFPWPSL